MNFKQTNDKTLSEKQTMSQMSNNSSMMRLEKNLLACLNYPAYFHSKQAFGQSFSSFVQPRMLAANSLAYLFLCSNRFEGDMKLSFNSSFKLQIIGTSKCYILPNNNSNTLYSIHFNMFPSLYSI